MQRGEIVQLGLHRLMCGDSTNPDDVAKLMEDNHAKILFTSPPYCDIRDYKGHNVSIEHLAKFIPVMKDYVDVMCVNLGIKRKDFEVIRYWDKYIEEANSCGLKLLSWNVWDKTFPGGICQQKAMFPTRHEFIFVFGEKVFKLNRTIPKRVVINNRTTVLRRQSDGSLRRESVNPNNDEPNKPLESVVAVIAERGPIRSKHPAVMPVKLPVEYIKAMTSEGDCVIDCFAGSGTTLIACEQTNRRCLAMEISEEYCDVIIERYEDFVNNHTAKRCDKLCNAVK